MLFYFHKGNKDLPAENTGSNCKFVKKNTTTRALIKNKSCDPNIEQDSWYNSTGQSFPNFKFPED